jgi:4-amino-4-deoxychorismate lyase
MSAPPSLQLFTSMRYDPILLNSSENSRPALNFIYPSPFYMLAYHRDRMVEAAQHFDFDAVTAALSDGSALHKGLLDRVKTWQTQEGAQDGPLKLRISFDKAGHMTVDFLSISAVPLSTLYPESLDPPNAPPKQPFKPSPLTGGALELGSGPTLPAPPLWTLRLDTQSTPRTPFTLLKTTQRTVYDASRARALPSNPQSSVHVEVILFNTVQEVTEGTLTSLYFFRGGRWVTPPVGVPEAYKMPVDGDVDVGERENADEGELRKPFPGRWGHSVRSAKVGAGGQRGTSRRWALGAGFCMEEPVGVDTITVGEGVWVSNGVRGFGFGTVVA